MSVFCGFRIRELREERGYALAELAKKAGISISYLSEIERGPKKPSLKMIHRLADALNVSVQQLLVKNDAKLEVGDRLRVLRKEKALTLNELAVAAKISVSYLSEIERGSVLPSIKIIRVLANKLKVPISSLLEQEKGLGEKVYRLRCEQGLTQTELAGKAGVSPALIGKIEHDKIQPSLQTVEKIASVLCVSPCYFIIEQDDIEGMLRLLNPEARDLLKEPQVQAVLRFLCDCSEKELRFVIDFIKLLKESRCLEEKINDEIMP